MAKAPHPDFSEYIDAIKQPLTSDSWAVDHSQENYGRLWRIQQEGQVLFRLTEGRTPIILQRGRTPWLVKIHLPSFITETALHKWRDAFRQEGAWMWLEHPNGDETRITLTAAIDGHEKYSYDTTVAMLQEGHVPFLDMVQLWLQHCLKTFKDDYFNALLGVTY